MFVPEATSMFHDEYDCSAGAGNVVEDSALCLEHNPNSVTAAKLLYLQFPPPPSGPHTTARCDTPADASPDRSGPLA